MPKGSTLNSYWPRWVAKAVYFLQCSARGRPRKAPVEVQADVAVRVGSLLDLLPEEGDWIAVRLHLVVELTVVQTEAVTSVFLLGEDRD